VEATTSKPIAKNLILFLIVIVIFSLIGTLTIDAAFTVTDDIYGGVKVGAIDVGGLSRAAAEEKVAAAFSDWTKHAPITIVYRDKSWPITAQDIDLSIDQAALANEAYAVGRTGNIINRLQERYLTINRGHFLPLNVSYNYDKLHAKIMAIAASIDREPQNASLALANFKVTKSPEAVGYKVDMAKTLSEIAVQLSAKIPFTMTLAVNEQKPTVYASDLEGIDGVIASYTTLFDPGDQNRSQNIAIAARNVNGVLVKQGEIFSFNTHVGPRLAQYGYKVAPVFINGRLVPDWGGGVCQVSSTLYNAVLLADMAIEERTSHFRPPGYVPLGQDATVADNYLDFKFRNNTDTNIYIMCDVYADRVNVHLLGHLRANPPEIQVISVGKKVLEPNTIVKQDPTLEVGREIIDVEGQKGFVVSTYRIKYANGKELARDFLATDEYEPEDRVVRVGTKAPAHRIK
jgi:vancomycin resistance protein YoaR